MDDKELPPVKVILIEANKNDVKVYLQGIIVDGFRPWVLISGLMPDASMPGATPVHFKDDAIQLYYKLLKG